jgi:hypothetical protein
MKKLLSLVLVVMFAFAFAACSRSSAPSTPEKTVEAFFNTLKAGKYSEAGNFTDMPIFEFLQDDEKQLLDDYFRTMTVSKPVVTWTDGCCFLVQVTLNAVDIFTVIQDFVFNVTAMAEAQGKSVEDMSDAELDNMLRQALRASDAPKKAITFEIDVRQDPRNPKRYVIIVNDTLRAGLFMQSVEEAYGSTGDDFEIIDSVETTARYLGGDPSNGECKFRINGQEIDMFCHTGHLNVLESNHKNKDVVIVYQVVARQDRNTGEIMEQLLVLLDIK